MGAVRSMLVNYVRDAPMLFSGSVAGITGMDTPGITTCTVKNGGFFVCNNSVEDMQYPSYSTGNGRDVVWEGACPDPATLLSVSAAHCRLCRRATALKRNCWGCKLAGARAPMLACDMARCSEYAHVLG